MPTVCTLLHVLALTLAQISPKRSFPHLRSCSKWLVDIGCGFGVATEVLLRERVPAQWTFETASGHRYGYFVSEGIWHYGWHELAN